MVNKRKLPLMMAAILLFIFNTVAFTQDLSFEVTVDKTQVAMDDQLTMSLTFSGPTQSLPSPPAMKACLANGAFREAPREPP